MGGIGRRLRFLPPASPNPIDWSKQHCLTDSPAVDIAMPTNTSAEVEAFEGRYLTPPELEKLVEQVAWFNPVYGLLVRLLGTTGMRVGELAGLNIGDVHILGSRGTISVHCTYDKRYGLSSSPKTSRSNRTVTLVPAVVPALAEHLASRRADGAGDDAPLFNARRGGGHYLDDWIKPKETPPSKHASEPKAEWRPFDTTKRFDAMAFYKRVWRRAISMAEVEPLRIHDLRHTAASLMLSSGMPIAMVSRQLGHASVSTTDLIYGGLLRDSIDTAVDTFGEWYAKQHPLGDSAFQPRTNRKVVPGWRKVSRSQTGSRCQAPARRPPGRVKPGRENMGLPKEPAGRREPSETRTVARDRTWNPGSAQERLPRTLGRRGARGQLAANTDPRPRDDHPPPPRAPEGPTRTPRPLQIGLGACQGRSVISSLRRPRMQSTRRGATPGRRCQGDCPGQRGMGAGDPAPQPHLRVVGGLPQPVEYRPVPLSPRLATGSHGLRRCNDCSDIFLRRGRQGRRNWDLRYRCAHNPRPSAWIQLLFKAGRDLEQSALI